MMRQPTFHPTTDRTWSQPSLWAMDSLPVHALDGIVEVAPDIVHIDGTERIDWPVTRCPMCRAAMPAGCHECPACGTYLDL